MTAVPAGHDPQKGTAIIMRRFIRWALTAASVAALGCGVAVPLATASAAATPACTTTVNWIGLPGDGYAGGQVVQLEFSNTGKVTCTLYGHPGVAQMDAGRQVGRPAIWTGNPATVTLTPGATAHAVLTVHNAGALCAQAPDLDVPERHRPGPAARVSGPIPVARLSRHVGDARQPREAGCRRAVLHHPLTALPAPAALLPALFLPAGRAAGRPGATPRAPIAPGLSSYW